MTQEDMSSCGLWVLRAVGFVGCGFCGLWVLWPVGFGDTAIRYDIALVAGRLADGV